MAGNSSLPFDCTSCRHFTPLPLAGGKQGACRRYPPTAHVVGVDNMGQIQSANMFPQVGPNIVCGEYQVRLALSALAGPASEISN